MFHSRFPLALWGTMLTCLVGLSSCQSNGSNTSTSSAAVDSTLQSQSKEDSTEAKPSTETTEEATTDTIEIASWTHPKYPKVNLTGIDSVKRKKVVTLARTGNLVAEQSLEARILVPKDPKLRVPFCQELFGQGSTKEYRNPNYRKMLDAQIESRWNWVLGEVRNFYPKGSKVEDLEGVNTHYVDNYDTDIVYQDEQILSTTTFTYAYSPETFAYGSGAFSGFTLLKGTAKKLSLDDIFTPNYTPKLGKLFLADLLRQYKVRSIGELSSQEQIQYDGSKIPDGSFYLTDKGLHYLVETGTIGGSTTFDLSIFVPYEALKPILKPNTFVWRYL